MTDPTDLSKDRKPARCDAGVQTDLMIDQVPNALPNARTGKIRVSLLKIQFGAIEGKDKPRAGTAT